MESLEERANEWVSKTIAERIKLKDEAYSFISKIVTKYGKGEGNKIVIDLAENGDTISIMEHDVYDGEYIARDIVKIEVSKKYGGVNLFYGEDEYEFIRLSDTLLTDRIFLIQQLLSILS